MENECKLPDGWAYELKGDEWVVTTGEAPQISGASMSVLRVVFSWAFIWFAINQSSGEWEHYYLMFSVPLLVLHP